jgi:hypothetical protein
LSALKLGLLAAFQATQSRHPVGHNHSISGARASPHLSNNIPGPVHTS